MEDNERRGGLWLRFRLATLFWIMLAIACFFAGVHWHDAVQAIVGRKHRDEKQPITLRIGESIQITTSHKAKLLLGNEAVAAVQPASGKVFQVTGKAQGATSVTVRNKFGDQQVGIIAVR